MVGGGSRGNAGLFRIAAGLDLPREGAVEGLSLLGSEKFLGSGPSIWCSV